MIDYEKVVGNLQILRTWCAVNPRYSKGLDAGDCEKAVGWLDDALELLKKQGPVRRGRWIPEPDRYNHWHCSECGFTEGIVARFYRFCPNCGADLREVEKDG